MICACDSCERELLAVGGVGEQGRPGRGAGSFKKVVFCWICLLFTCLLESKEFCELKPSAFGEGEKGRRRFTTGGYFERRRSDEGRKASECVFSSGGYAT